MCKKLTLVDGVVGSTLDAVAGLGVLLHVLDEIHIDGCIGVGGELVLSVLFGYFDVGVDCV